MKRYAAFICLEEYLLREGSLYGAMEETFEAAGIPAAAGRAALESEEAMRAIEAPLWDARWTMTVSGNFGDEDGELKHVGWNYPRANGEWTSNVCYVSHLSGEFARLQAAIQARRIMSQGT